MSSAGVCEGERSGPAVEPAPRAVLAEAVAEVSAALSGFEPRDVPLPEVPALLDLFVELERLGASGRLLLAARAAESPRWKREGFRSAAEWMAARSGTSTGRARRDLQTSELLGKLDGTAEAMRHGRLSPDQAEVVADAAAANPEAEADLLRCAVQEALAGLKDEAARRKAEVEDLEGREHRIQRDRRWRTWTDREGVWNLSARGPLAAGSAFMADLERLTDRHFRDARRDGRSEERQAYAFDALVGMGGGRGVERPKAPNVRHLGLLHVDLEALKRGFAQAGETCELPGVGPVSVATARELLGDSVLKLVITRGVDVLNVTHLGRGPNAAQEIALLWAQPICQAAGCNRRARLEVDHRHEFHRDRVTELPNLDRLCDHHHDLKTRSGWRLVDGTGRRPLVPPDDPRHPGDWPSARRPNAPPGAG